MRNFLLYSPWKQVLLLILFNFPVVNIYSTFYLQITVVMLLFLFVSSEVLCDGRLEAAVPCNRCSRVAFCSVACQTQALTTHHMVECPILETLWSSGASIICLMALRMLSQRGLKYFLDMKDILEKVCA